jgi:hypothetical protein
MATKPAPVKKAAPVAKPRSTVAHPPAPRPQPAAVSNRGQRAGTRPKVVPVTKPPVKAGRTPLDDLGDFFGSAFNLAGGKTKTPISRTKDIKAKDLPWRR